ncbi:MAG: hypothetical protein ACKVU0_05315 [Saprospiraceae bacterium]
MITTIPTWELILKSNCSMFHEVTASAEPVAMRVVLATYNERVIPCVILKCPDSKFRTSLSDSTPCVLLVDIVTVLPFPTPFAYVMPVIFDDIEDPYWKICCLNLFPIDKIGGVDLLFNSAIDPLYSRTIMSSFCQINPECGIIVLNQRNEIQKSEIIKFPDNETSRFGEIKEVLDHLNNFQVKKDYYESVYPQEIFTNNCCFLIENPTGKKIFVPKKRSLKNAQDYVFSIKVAHRRLIDRRALDTDFNTDLKYDLFVSHAHIDSENANKIVNSLNAIWPRLDISITKPQDDETFKNNPVYFLENSIQSRSIVFIASPDSINRPMVQTEIGRNAGKPIIILLINGLSRETFIDNFANNLFISFDEDKIIDLNGQKGWDQFIVLIGSTLKIVLPDSITENPVLTYKKTVDIEDINLIDSYVKDHETIYLNRDKNQSYEDACRIVENAFQEYIDQSPLQYKAQLLVVSRHLTTPQAKLVFMMVSTNDETYWINVIDAVPAFINEKLVHEIDKQIESLEEFDDTGLIQILVNLKMLIQKSIKK